MRFSPTFNPGACDLAEFRRTTELDADKLLAAANAGDLAQVEQIAHRIEDACSIIGAAGLARACCLVAASGKSDGAGELRTALDSFIKSKQAPYDFMAEPDAGQLCAGLVFLVLDLAMPSLNGIEVARIAGEEKLPLQTARSYGATVLGAVSKPLTQAKLAPLLAQHRHLLADKLPPPMDSR